MILKPIDIKVTVWPDVGWRIQWSLEKKDVPVGAYSISVDRASSPEGPWSEVGASLDIDDVSYEDRLVESYRSIWELIYYRLRIVEDGVGDHFLSEPVTNVARSDRIGNEIIRQHELILYGRNGHPGFYSRDFACFKRTKFGLDCTYCKDAVTGERVVPRCKICNGTGYVEGYANPVKFRGRFLNSPSKVDNVTVSGEMQVDMRTIFMAAYPIIDPGDILAEKGSGNRWHVESVDASMPGDSIVSQRVSVSRVRRESIANSLYYP